MKVFYTTAITGFWPVGAAAIAAADTKQGAIDLFEKLIDSESLRAMQEGATIDPESVKELNTEARGAVMLLNGDY